MEAYPIKVKTITMINQVMREFQVAKSIIWMMVALVEKMKEVLHLPLMNVVLRFSDVCSIAWVALGGKLFKGVRCLPLYFKAGPRS
jgi:hypothetical protein